MMLNFLSMSRLGYSKSIKIIKVKEIECHLKNTYIQYMTAHFCNSCQFKYRNEVENVINRQIKTEQQAAQDYLSIAVHFLHPNIGRPGTGGYFMHMYKEEIGHMIDMIRYQLMRGGNVEVPSIKAPLIFESLTICDAFIRALSMEKYVTQVCLHNSDCFIYLIEIMLHNLVKMCN